MRLRGGFGSLCDPVHSGFIEVLHAGEWGSICTDESVENQGENRLVADVVCRQLGFPHGTRVDPLTAQPPSTEAPSPFNADNRPPAEEAEEPVERFWLRDVACSGPEGRLVDCNLGQGFRNNNAGCSSNPHRIHAACRQFPVVEALEAITTPGAGASQSTAWDRRVCTAVHVCLSAWGEGPMHLPFCFLKLCFELVPI